MFGQHHIPDWGFGLLMAGASWFGLVYGLLAPRAMDNDLVTEAIPQCQAHLEDEQSSSLAKATKRAVDEARYSAERLSKQYRSELREWQNKRVTLQAYNFQKENLCNTGICAIMPIPLPDIGVDAKQVDQAINALKAKLAGINYQPTISFPELPSDALTQRCACAAAKTVAGVRTEYAISLASFRLIEPEEIGAFKESITQIAGTDICGKKPWEVL